MPACPRCQKDFQQKGHLDSHMAKKKQCVQKTLPIAEPTPDMSKKTLAELIAYCKEKGIKKYSGKPKADVLALIQPTEVVPETTNVKRLNYIGSKFQLLSWIQTNIQEQTGWTSFRGKTIGDIFAGTGIVSHHFRTLGASIISNDAELYSSVIVHAMTRSTYTQKCQTFLARPIDEEVGFITTHYSPHAGNERMFFTIPNAKRIDFLRKAIEDEKNELTNDEYMFLLASLLLSADAVSNVPAVYGCYLKHFKAKSIRSLILKPIHTLTMPPVEPSVVFQDDVLTAKFPHMDMVYIDPPYNQRQYSKNYFPLNMIVRPSELPLKGKTGIPADCFLSSFCRKGVAVEEAFDTLFRTLDADWIFMSYNSESLLSKEKVMEIAKKYGDVSVIERDYKRFKSFEYNEDVSIQEYLFCIKRV